VSKYIYIGFFFLSCDVLNTYVEGGNTGNIGCFLD